MVFMKSATALVKPEEAEESTCETKSVKLSGLSAVQVREKAALGSMLYLLVSPSITLSEEWRESMVGAVRSVVNTKEPAGEGEGARTHSVYVMYATSSSDTERDLVRKGVWEVGVYYIGSSCVKSLQISTPFQESQLGWDTTHYRTHNSTALHTKIHSVCSADLPTQCHRQGMVQLAISN